MHCGQQSRSLLRAALKVTIWPRWPCAGVRRVRRYRH